MRAGSSNNNLGAAYHCFLSVSYVSQCFLQASALASVHKVLDVTKGRFNTLLEHFDIQNKV